MEEEARNGTSTRRFIFSDEFYDNIENENKDFIGQNNDNNNDIAPSMQPIEPIKEIPKVEDTFAAPVIEPNNFFNNQVIETTTVYDDLGNTISKTITDSNKPGEVIEEIKAPEPVVEENEQPEIVEGPNLGIPTKNDLPELKEIDIPKIEDAIPSIVDNTSNINLNVETGFDKNLEQQLINEKAMYEPEPEIENEYLKYLNKDGPVEKYRAVRNNNIPTVNYDEENNQIETPENPDLEPLKPAFDSLQETADNWEPDVVIEPTIITEEINYDEPIKEEVVTKSDLLVRLAEKEKETGKISILARYGDDFTSRDYITNPAIGRDNEIKELGLILLTPEKSAILVGKPGIGKTSIVEGLAYHLQRDNVPDALKGFTIISVKTTSLLGSLTNGETRLQTLIDELKELDKIILFVDEVHMLMGATNESSLDFANMFKESLGRGSIKMIGATTSEEYERYVLRDKAFVRRFQRVDVNEPTREETIEILMGTLPKIEKTTGAKLKYTHFIKTEIMAFIVDITTEYKRVYGIGSRYPDICITLLNQAFSEAVFNNRDEVNIFDIRSAIEHSKNIYPDVIRKELVNFDQKFQNVINDENNQ